MSLINPVRDDGPEEKSYFGTSHCHASTILDLLERSQDSQCVQSPESVQQNLIYKKAKHPWELPLKLLWWDAHDWGRDDRSGCHVRKDTCELYGFGPTSRVRTNRSGAFTDKPDVDRWHDSIKTRRRYKERDSWLLRNSWLHLVHKACFYSRIVSHEAGEKITWDQRIRRRRVRKRGIPNPNSCSSQPWTQNTETGLVFVSSQHQNAAWKEELSYFSWRGMSSTFSDCTDRKPRRLHQVPDGGHRGQRCDSQALLRTAKPTGFSCCRLQKTASREPIWGGLLARDWRGGLQTAASISVLKHRTKFNHT